MIRHGYHSRWLTLLLALLLAALACNLTGADPTPKSSQPTIPPAGQAASPTFAIPTSLPLSTLFPMRTEVPPTLEPCRPITSWPIYYVQDGDTLGQIADRVGMNFEALRIANCLANSDLIYIGQPLFVPLLPATSTPEATLTLIPTIDATIPLFAENLHVERYWVDPFGQAVTYNHTVRIDVGVIANASRVDLYVDDLGGAGAHVINQDLDPGNGALWDYTFPAPGTYTFMAIAENLDHRTNSSVFTIRYDPNYYPPDGSRNALQIAPYVLFDYHTYMLKVGTTVTITWPDAPAGATDVDFFLYPNGTSVQPQLIGSDLNQADGTSITWLVQGGAIGNIQADATNPDGSTVASGMVPIIAQY
jgi:hypothetical protein